MTPNSILQLEKLGSTTSVACAAGSKQGETKCYICKLLVGIPGSVAFRTNLRVAQKKIYPLKE